MATVPWYEQDDQPRSGSYSVLVVDDHQLFSMTLVMALRQHGLKAELIRHVSMDAILAAAADLPRGIVLLDLDLGRDADGRSLTGCDLVPTLQSMGWKVIVITGIPDQRRIAAAIAAGALGVVAKSASLDALLKATLSATIRKTIMSEQERHMWLEIHRNHLLRQRQLAQRVEKLTNRERTILDMLAQGQRAAAIADQCVVSLATVRSQIQSILSKFGVNSQLEAVALIREYCADS